MSAQADKAIADILTTYGETFSASVWRVQGTAVIYHKSLERIAAKARIVFDAPVVIRSERDEAVMIVTGRMPGPERELVEWSVGEAAIGQNYRVSGKQAAYPWSMAEKRGKDRVILKLIGLSGVLYSEDEADDFRPTQETREQTKREAAQSQTQRSASDAREAPKADHPAPGTPEWREALFKHARARAALGNEVLNKWWSERSGEAQAALEEINDELDEIVNRAAGRREAAE